MENTVLDAEQRDSKINWLKIAKVQFSVVFGLTGLMMLFLIVYVFKMTNPFASGIDGMTRALSLKCWLAVFAYPFLGYLIWRKQVSLRFVLILALLVTLLLAGICWAVLPWVECVVCG